MTPLEKLEQEGSEEEIHQFLAQVTGHVLTLLQALLAEDVQFSMRWSAGEREGIMAATHPDGRHDPELTH